jgi:hypothetical protein
MSARSEARWDRLGEFVLLVLDGPYGDSIADILRMPDGSIGWLQASGRIHAREAR